MSASYLPGMGSLTTLGAWIEQHEELLCQSLLLNPESASRALCAVYLSRLNNGEYLLRRCEGRDDQFLVWQEQRRLRSLFGEPYAIAQFNLWLAVRENEGYAIQWNAQPALNSGESLAA